MLKKGQSGDTWVSLGGGNRIDFMDGLEVGGDVKQNIKWGAEEEIG